MTWLRLSLSKLLFQNLIRTMKKFNIIFFLIICPILAYSQAKPIIEADLLLCPNQDGTARVTNATVENYESYRWFYKYWFNEDDDFEVIEDATDSVFAYDWYNYDQSLLFVEVIIDGDTLTSDTVLVDSYAWSGLVTGYDNMPNYTYNPNTGNLELCEGTSLLLEVNDPPYDVVQWYKDDVKLEGDTMAVLEISEAGSYHVVAAPSFCPLSETRSLNTDVTLVSGCTLGLEETEGLDLAIYPNPASDYLIISNKCQNKITNIEMIDIAGRKVLEDNVVTSSIYKLDISSIPTGVYILKMDIEGKLEHRKIQVKK